MVASTFELTPLGDSLEKFLADSNVSMAAGFFDDVYPDGTPVADVAFDNEYGIVQNNQPPRPFMRPTLVSNGTKWIAYVGDNVGGMFKGGLDIRGIFDVLGEIVTEDIQKSIRSVNTPKLAPMTLDRRVARGNSSIKPLEDTKQMINSVFHVVEK